MLALNISSGRVCTSGTPTEKSVRVESFQRLEEHEDPAGDDVRRGERQGDGEEATPGAGA